jgi:glycerol-3-phosphate cytidylyltransferase
MTTVITYGTFDLFHVGHVRLLKRLRELGDRLVVGCSTDEFNVIKGKKAVLSYTQRVEVLQSCRHVDAVFPEDHWDQKRPDILREKADIFAMGDDWLGKFDHLEDVCRVVYLTRTENISTTDIRHFVKVSRQDEVRRAKAAAQHLVDMIGKMESADGCEGVQPNGVLKMVSSA